MSEPTSVGLHGSHAGDRVPRPSHAERATLVHGLWRIGAARVSTGNRVALLRDGPATFDAMLALIASTRDRVSLESYIVRSDAVGERFAPGLVAAARRGVRTRVLFDWIGSRSTSSRFAGADMDQAFERSWDRGIRPGPRPREASRPSGPPAAALDDDPAMVAIMEGEPGRYRVARSLEVASAGA